MSRAFALVPALLLSTGCARSFEGGDDEPEPDPDEWSGSFEGEYLGSDQSEVTFELDCLDHVLTGDASDARGESVIENSTCSATDVEFDKRYVSGSGVGIVNHYVGTREEMHLEGTWDGPMTGTGTWYADEVAPE